jgi:phage-related tail protein
MVEETDAKREAYLAMDATLQGYLDALEDETVTAAIQSAGDRWKNQIKNIFGDYSPSANTLGRGGMSAADAAKMGYASGTTNAKRGWALVGEKGPELLRFQGGETVVNAEETRKALAYDLGIGGGETVSLTINLPAGATAETVREAKAYAGDIEAMVKKVLKEQKADAKRRAFV